MPIVKNYNCFNCGAPITNLKSPSGTCEYCQTTYVIEGLKTCQEIANSENVKSGVSFNANPNMLHTYIVDFLTSEISAPLDVLEKTEIIQSEYICIPAYYYHYNGTSDYMCDVGNDNQRHIQDKEGNTSLVTETQWSTISGNTRAEVERIVSGNKDYDYIIDEIYTPYENGILTDIESLEIPFNAVTLKFTRPASELLNKYVRADMKNALEKSALSQMSGRKCRNISIGNCNIERDETVDKILAGLYHINFKYEANTYSIYVTGDGKKVKYENNPPVDANRLEEINSLNETYNSANSSLSLITTGIVIAVILTIILFASGGALGIVGVIAAVLGIVKRMSLKTKLNESYYRINNFNQQLSDIKEKFNNSNQKLKGASKHLFT